MDELQASFLRIKLKHLEDYNEARNKVAKRYLNEIKNPKVKLPQIGNNRTHVWHVFAIMCEDRDDLKIYLENKGIHTGCHYPISIANQKAYEQDNLPKLSIAKKIANQELSLPMYYGMTDNEVDYIVDAINNY